jgi:cell division protein FtsI/penicillin-binding protein 2
MRAQAEPAGVDPDDVASDPEANDPFAEYRADERLGTSGVEYAAERMLRGRRGQITLDRDNAVIEDIAELPRELPRIYERVVRA